MLAAYTTTTAAKSAAISLDEVIHSSNQQVTISGSGVMTFTTPETAELQFSVPRTGTFVLRLFTPELYMQVPAGLHSQMPPGKSWVAINLDQITKSQLGASLSQLSNSSTMPTQYLSYLQAVSTNGVSREGSATIRGVHTTRYQAAIDLDRAGSRNGAASTAIQRLEAQLHQAALPIQVWLDDQGRVRQLKYSVPIPAAPANAGSASSSGAGGGSLDATMDFYDFGVPVDVTAPPASQIEDVTGQFAGG